MYHKIVTKWIPIFLFILGFFFLIRSFCHAEHFDMTIPQAEYELSLFCDNRISVADEFFFSHREARWQGANDQRRKEQQKALREKWQQDYEFHQFHAIRTYNDAKDRAWWLPNIDARTQFRMCWTSAFSMVGHQNPTLALVVAISSYVMQYGLECYDEYNYINDKLYWSEFHFRECERLAALIHGF